MVHRASLRLLVVAVTLALLVSHLVLAPERARAQLLRCHGHRGTKQGTHNSDRIYGTPGRDVLIGLHGNDILIGFGGDDIICGGDGRDILLGFGGDDLLDSDQGDLFKPRQILLGGNGNDRLIAGEGPDVLSGHKGNDSLRGGFGDDALFGRSGNDTIDGQSGADLIHGGPGNDDLVGGEDRDLLSYFDAPSGVRLSLGQGRARGVGRDKLRGFEDVEGSAERDVITGNDSTNFLFGRRGHDVLQGRAGMDLLMGESGDDRLDGGRGQDTGSYYFTVGVNVNMETGVTNKAGTDSFKSVDGIEAGVNGTLRGTDGPEYFLTGRTDRDGDKDKLIGRGGKDVFVHRQWRGTFTEMVARGGEGDDFFRGIAGSYSYGGPGKDRIRGRGEGGEGNDLIKGDQGSGGSGNDLLIGTNSSDSLAGGPGDDVFHTLGGEYDEVIHEYDQSDPTLLETGNDVVSFAMERNAGVTVDLEARVVQTNSGQDLLRHGWFSVMGSSLDDVMNGRTEPALDPEPTGNETMWGSKGEDSLNGLGGDDNLGGGKGDDTADGGDGFDLCPNSETSSNCEDLVAPEPPLPTRALASTVRDLLAALAEKLGADDVVSMADVPGGLPSVQRTARLMDRTSIEAYRP